MKSNSYSYCKSIFIHYSTTLFQENWKKNILNISKKKLHCSQRKFLLKINKASRQFSTLLHKHWNCWTHVISNQTNFKSMPWGRSIRANILTEPYIPVHFIRMEKNKKHIPSRLYEMIVKSLRLFNRKSPIIQLILMVKLLLNTYQIVILPYHW